MSFGKGSNQNTTTTTQTPDPAAMAAYRGLLNRAAGVANLPYQAYGGEGVAPINAQQYAGIGNINQNAGFALPYIQQATQYANQAAQPITGAQIAGFQSPYTQQVVNATEAQFNNQNAQQQQQVLGNAIAQGALGGDRTAVAQANLAGQQQMAEAPVIAGLYNQGYQNAQQMALAQQQAMAQGAYSLGNLGVAGQNAALTGANAQVGAGSLEQQTQNALDQYLYGQFMQGQAFPYQQAQWLAGIDTGVGSQMGGTSTTTGPPPNPWNTAAGLGVAALGAMAPSKSASGGRIRGFAPGGMVSPTMAPAMGGAPQPNPMAGFAGNPTLQRVGDALQSGFGNMMQRVDSNPRLAGLMSEFQKYMPQWGGWGGQSGPQAGFGQMMGRPGFDDGGEVSGFGGVPYGGAGGYIPGAFQGQHGNTMPKPPGAPSSGGSSGAGGIPGLNANALGAAGKGLGDIGSSLYSGFGEMFPEAGAYLENPSLIGEGLSDVGGALMGGLGDLGGAMAGAFGGGEAAADLLPLLLLAKRGGRINGKRAGFAPGGEVDLSNAYPLGDIDPNDASTNNFGFNFNPVRTDANTAYPEPTADVPMPRSRPTLGDVTAPSDNGIYMPVPREPEPTPIVGAARVGPPEEEKQSGLFGGWGLSDAARTGLITAGLGMMASRSPNLWNAIGEGGLAGMHAYSGEKKQAASIEEARKRLEQHADEVSKKLALESKKISDAEQARQDTQTYRTKMLEQGKLGPGQHMVDGRIENVPGYAEALQAAEAAKAAGKGAASQMSPEAKEIMARQMIAGNFTGYNSLGRTAQGLAVRNELNNMATEIAMKENGFTPAQAADHLNRQKQEFSARQIGLNTEARTAGQRETNLNLILRMTDAAIPAALEASEKVARTGWVPINRIIQKGEVITSNTELAQFGMANLQLAEAWARAMNPTGVMRESDRDMALNYLNTATSKETYAALVHQLQKQITRERDSIRGVNPATPINPNAPSPAPGGGTVAAAPDRDAIEAEMRRRGLTP